MASLLSLSNLIVRVSEELMARGHVVVWRSDVSDGQGKEGKLPRVWVELWCRDQLVTFIGPLESPLSEERQETLLHVLTSQLVPDAIWTRS